MAIVIIGSSTLNVAHHSLLTWADSSVLNRHGALSMEATDLELTELHIKVGNEVFKDVSALGHEFGGLLVSQDLLDVLFGSLKVREQKYEYLLWIPGDFDKVHDVTNLVEVAVEDLSTHLNAAVVVSDSHGRRSLLGNNVYLVRAIVKFLHATTSFDP